MNEHRVVILARDGELAPPNPQTLGLNVTFVRAEGGYEAAAELLAQPAMALLIDLPCLTPRHRKLLHVARLLKVEVLGVGAFPPGLSAGDLSGMRLISMNDLPATLRAITPHPTPAAAAKPSAVAPKPPVSPAPTTASTVAAALKKEGVHLAPARKAEYQPSPPETHRQSRIIAPAPSRDISHPSGREG